MKKSRKIAAIVLSLILVMTWMLGGCSKIRPNTNQTVNSEIASEEITEADISSLLDNTWQAPGGGETTSETPETPEGHWQTGLKITYEHYDPTEFLAGCEKLDSMAEDGDIDEITSLYAELKDQLLYQQDLYTLADLLTNEDVTDDDLEEEKDYTYEILTESSDAFDSACKKVIKGKNGKAFTNYLDDDYAVNYYETYVEMTPELKQLLMEEEDLKDQYYDLINAYEDVTYMYNGKLYRLGDILDDQAFYSADPNGYLEVYSGCLKALNDDVGGVYVKLVKLRNEKAKFYGYKNYCEYADKEVFGRDYSEKDLEGFKKGVKDFGGDFWMYYQYLEGSLPDYGVTDSKIVADARECIEGISDYSDEATKYMTDNHLYSVGDESNRIDGGYTVSFDTVKQPFIFFTTGNGVWDLTGIVHEMGHYTDAYRTPNPHPQCGEGSYDIYEIHSNGLQLLAGPRYKDVIGRGGALVEAYTIFSAMTSVSEGCMYDEWEREIYKNPDMTLDEINALYKKLSIQYGAGADYPGAEYLWMFIHHHFVSPMYYISYATSCYAALQIKLQSAEDYDGAVKTWEKLIDDSAYDKGYEEVVTDAGLKYFSNSKEVKNILQGVFDLAVNIVMEEN